MAVLFTIGHSNHSADRFVGLLAQQHVDLLIDVRSVPHSRFSPQFNKAALERLVNYPYLGTELGGRPREPEFYDAAGHVDYAALAETDRFQGGIQRLVDEASSRTVAIMCAEEDPARCHRRRLVGHAMTGYELHHIRGDGRVEIELTLGTP